MIMFERAVEDIERPVGLGWRFPDVVALGRWINPVLGGLGALVLSGYLMAGDPSTPAVTAPASHSYSSVAQDESPQASMIDLVKAGVAAAFALGLAMVGMWLGMRRARSLSPAHERALDGCSTIYPSAENGCEPPKAPTCERMCDETRLVPQFLRDTEFPATRLDLLRLADVYTDEGRALRRLQHVPDRRYNTLHDLIVELRVD